MSSNFISRRSLILAGLAAPAFAAKPALRAATFEADITPPLGTPLCIALTPKADRLEDRLSARGVLLLPEREKPIVMCALDWISVGNHSQERWKNALAKAAGTTPDRVMLQTVHQHDAPGDDQSAEELLRTEGLSDLLMSLPFAQAATNRVAAALKAAKPRPVTHVGIGEAKAEGIASNRRILGPDGKVIFGRMTSCRNSEYCAAPEGLIDPMLKSISLFDGEVRVATLSYYATHPMSHYGKGAITCDFPGLARAQQPGFQIHFNGAGGNIGAGKYNDGSDPRRPVLAERMADAMKRAREAEKRYKVETPVIRSTPVRLPHREGAEFTEDRITADLKNKSLEPKFRANAARYLAWYRLLKAGREIPITRVQLGPANIIHMPGELFVEYQLAAQKERSSEFIAMAAYGEYGPMYIGTAKAYEQGGYECGPVSRVGPGTEDVLMSAVKRVFSAL